MLPKFLHGMLERAGHLAGANEFTIEMLHEFRSALIMHVPQRQKQRGGAGAEETTLKPEQLVSGSDEIHAGGATAQRNQICVQPHLVEIVQIQVTVTQPDA